MAFAFGLYLAAIPSRLIALHAVDLAIIGVYFVTVLGIGFYLKGQSGTGEDFFLAGREMTAWIAGLSFLSANLRKRSGLTIDNVSSRRVYQSAFLAGLWIVELIGSCPATSRLIIPNRPNLWVAAIDAEP